MVYAADGNAHGTVVASILLPKQRETISMVSESQMPSSLRARLAVEVAGELTRGLYRYTRVRDRDNGKWRIAGGYVSEIIDDAHPTWLLAITEPFETVMQRRPITPAERPA